MHRRASAVSVAISSMLLVAACKHEVAERCEAYPVFFSVQSPNYEIVAREQPGGPRLYTITDKAGHIIERCILERAVSDRYPDAAAAIAGVKATLRTPQIGYVE